MAVKNIQHDEITTFTLEEDVSIANAIRRTIINDIPTWVFRTSPHDKNEATFHVNTTRMNNELLKQRLSCIPIHCKYGEGVNLEDYYLEVNAENTTDTLIQVTTEHFVVKRKDTKEPDPNMNLFPPYIAPDGNSYYILFINLRPRISEEIPGEKLHFVCNFSVSTARESAMFNVTSLCSYGNTLDNERIERELSVKRHEWEQEMSKEEVADNVKNWWLLDAKRIYKENSFDFSVQTVGVFENSELIVISNRILRERVRKLSEDVSKLSITPSLTTMENSYDITFVDDYTVGKPLEYMLYKKYFGTTLAYCGYIKLHPHDEESIIRIAFHPQEKNNAIENVADLLTDALQKLSELFQTIEDAFNDKKRK